MPEENDIVPPVDAEDAVEELPLELDGTPDPDAVWEWNGDSWVAVAG